MLHVTCVLRMIRSLVISQKFGGKESSLLIRRWCAARMGVGAKVEGRRELLALQMGAV